MLHGLREMFGQFGGHIQLGNRLAVNRRLRDHQTARMQMHLAANTAGKEGVLPAIFSVAHNRVADGRHMRAQLVGASG